MVRFFAFSWRAVLAGAALGATVAAAAMVMPQDAAAKATYESPYSYDRTWNSALRLVRVDLGFKVTEKDEQSGYLLFEYRSPESGNKVTPGSFEMVRGRDDAPVRVVVQLPAMPQYHEQALLDSLVAKMRSEYGDPPPKRKPQPTPPDAAPPDAPVQPSPPPPQ